MRRSLQFAIGGFIATLVIAAYAQNYICQLDNTSMYFTGNTKLEWGKLLKEYKCPNGHTAWVVSK